MFQRGIRLYSTNSKPRGYSVKEHVNKMLDTQSISTDRVLNMHEFAIKTTVAMTLAGFTGLYYHMDKRFEHVDKRFEQVDKRFDKIESDISEIKNILVAEFSKHK